METLVEKVSWRRRGSRNAFVGSLRAGGEGIRLVGRDPVSGIDVALSIPSTELERVHVGPANGELCVVLELDAAEPIFLQGIGSAPFQAQVLARRLGELLHPPRLLVQGGLR